MISRSRPKGPCASSRWYPFDDEGSMRGAAGPMGETQARRAEIPGTLITDYLYRQAPEPDELVLLLHGYQQSGKHLFDKLVPCFSERAAILAPNGPYPLPE